MSGILDLIDALSDKLGKLIVWLLFAVMLLTCTVVVMRYGFQIGSIATQEAINYCHATAFLLGAAFALRHNEHVRVDIFYHRFNRQQQAWVDAIGSLIFLIPFTLFLCFASWSFFADSLAIRESSNDPGGLPYVYLLKGLIPLSMAILCLQAVSLFLRNALVLVLGEEE